MKRILFIMLAVVMTLAARAQSTNPLNYSGTMYVESFTVIETPRYISYEDHAILTKKMTIPTTEIMKVIMDFEKGKINLSGKDSAIKVTGCKKYTEDYSWVVVVYFEFAGGDKLELVWKEHGKPFLQQITPGDGKVKIARITLSQKPVASSPEDVLMGLFQGLGGL